MIRQSDDNSTMEDVTARPANLPHARLLLALFAELFIPRSWIPS